MEKKMNLEIAKSQNFNKVTIGFYEEPVEAGDEEQLRAEIRKRFKIIREEIKHQFEVM